MLVQYFFFSLSISLQDMNGKVIDTKTKQKQPQNQNAFFFFLIKNGKVYESQVDK